MPLGKNFRGVGLAKRNGQINMPDQYNVRMDTTCILVSPVLMGALAVDATNLLDPI